jgi:hypothetical protein
LSLSEAGKQGQPNEKGMQFCFHNRSSFALLLIEPRPGKLRLRPRATVVGCSRSCFSDGDGGPFRRQTQK